MVALGSDHPERPLPGACQALTEPLGGVTAPGGIGRAGIDTETREHHGPKPNEFIDIGL
jgi:hypothetical protein